MEKLKYSSDVFYSGAGRIYQLLINISMPAMVAGVMVIALINSGGMKQFGEYPDWVKLLFLLLIALYVVPCLFIFPTVWMIRTWKTRNLRESYVMVSNRSVEYHKIADQTVSSMTENVYIATQIKKVEETKRKYIISGNVVETATGNKSNVLEIPVAFENMERIKRAARYR